MLGKEEENLKRWRIEKEKEALKKKKKIWRRIKKTKQKKREEGDLKKRKKRKGNEEGEEWKEMGWKFYLEKWSYRRCD